MPDQANPQTGASPAAIRHHYDLSNDFYRLWLDPTMTYSCALWGENDTLESAQLRKLDHTVESARAHGARRVLDIGCGWGSMLRRLVEHHGVEQAVGLTLSSAQAAWVAAQELPRCQVHVESWASHTPAAPYDAIVSIGAFEHFVRFGLSRAAKVENYREFFRRCHEFLAPGGWLALQTIAKGGVPLRPERMMDVLFIASQIFPESDLPRLAEIAHATEKLFEIVSVRNDREDYARTCREWKERLAARRDEAVAVVGETAVDVYERYLAISIEQFDKGHAVLLRLAMRKVTD